MPVRLSNPCTSSQRDVRGCKRITPQHRVALFVDRPCYSHDKSKHCIPTIIRSLVLMLVSRAHHHYADHYADHRATGTQNSPILAWLKARRAQCAERDEHEETECSWKKWKNILPTVISFCSFLYYDAHDAASPDIQWTLMCAICFSYRRHMRGREA